MFLEQTFIINIGLTKYKYGGLRMIKVGSKGKVENIVNSSNTANRVGSGTLEVFSTPMMIALMENAAINAIELPKEQSSVGISIDIKHIAATPIGMKVWAEAEVLEVDGRRIVFKIEAYDEIEKIGEGRHERYIINNEKFLAKANSKLG
jgi:fluoroacetyl-CoA thioesterase